jgi:hypothetical protein
MSLAPSLEEETMGGRPARAVIEERIRTLHAQAGGLSRVHRTHPALYAQARRAFGSWRAAVKASGIDYDRELDRSFIRGLQRRDERRATVRALRRFLADHPGANDEELAAARPALAGLVTAYWGDLARALAWMERRP